jgi:hypothetical protein
MQYGATDLNQLSSLASEYAKSMTSIRGRRVQRLLIREFAGADSVVLTQVGQGTAAVLGVSASGAALCATDGRGREASVFKWAHGSATALETRFDLHKDSLPVLGTKSLPLAQLQAQMPLQVAASAAPPVLLAGGNPQIAKADGDAAVQAYIAAIPGWKRDIARSLDKLVTQTVPGVQKAIRWNSPMYGMAGQGWFVSFHVFTRYVKVTFFKGTSLQPVPPGGTAKEARWVDVHEDDLDKAQMARWLRQAAAIRGWGK